MHQYDSQGIEDYQYYRSLYFRWAGMPYNVNGVDYRNNRRTEKVSFYHSFIVRLSKSNTCPS